jgi:hypothetical protein|tara:strand:- start:2418 stop:2588 length:171 start_codon:yes stop_codon:yes gene_type:complete
MTLGESILDILAVIESAKARNGRETLQNYVAKMLISEIERRRLRSHSRLLNQYRYF